MALCLAIVASLAYLVRAFHEPSSRKALQVRARADLIRFRDRVSIARSQNPEKAITRLDQVLEEGETGEDPWGTPYLFEGGRRIVSLGENGRLDIVGERRPDDQEEPLPPNPVATVAAPNTDRSRPVIDPVGPIGMLSTARPEFWARYRDGGSGIAAPSARLILDGTVLEGTATAAEIRGQPPTDLASGVHLIRVEVGDKAGNLATRHWNVIVP